jgi:L-asparaginase
MVCVTSAQSFADSVSDTTPGGPVLPRTRLIATGGTIASRRSPQGLLSGATGAELLEAAGLAQAGIEVEDVGSRGSYAFTLADLTGLAGRVRAALDDGVDGVVLTHGTDTMEETAFLLELVHGDDRPVVLTGAQRPFDSVAPDGPGNLAAALQVAASPHARGLGALLVFDGLAWQARGVRKTETLASGAFSAPGRGPALRIVSESVLPLSRQRRPAPFRLDTGPLPRVDVVPLYVGVADALLQAAVAAGARGVVLQALGAGNAPPSVTDSVGRLVAGGIPVLVTSRVTAGPVSPLYAGGGGADLARAGAVFAADLSPWQARLLLSAALAGATDDPGAAVSEWLGLG